MRQFSLMVLSQFWASPSECFVQTAHNFDVLFLIERPTIWQELMMHYATEIKENSAFDRICRFLSVSVLYAAFIGTIVLLILMLLNKWYKILVCYYYNIILKFARIAINDLYALYFNNPFIWTTVSCIER